MSSFQASVIYADFFFQLLKNYLTLYTKLTQPNHCQVETQQTEASHNFRALTHDVTLFKLYVTGLLFKCRHCVYKMCARATQVKYGAALVMYNWFNFKRQY